MLPPEAGEQSPLRQGILKCPKVNVECLVRFGSTFLDRSHLVLMPTVVIVGDQGEERFQQVEDVDPAQHQQHFVDVVEAFPLVVVWMSAAFVRVDVQT